MSFLIGKTQPAAPPPSAEVDEENADGVTINNNKNKKKNSGEKVIQEDESCAGVSSHVYLKPVHSTEKLNKEVVLRRIRQRKRVNKVRAALQGFAGSGYSANSSSNDNVVHVRWLDDAFAAP